MARRSGGPGTAKKVGGADRTPPWKQSYLSAFDQQVSAKVCTRLCMSTRQALCMYCVTMNDTDWFRSRARRSVVEVEAEMEVEDCLNNPPVTLRGYQQSLTSVLQAQPEHKPALHRLMST